MAPELKKEVQMSKKTDAIISAANSPAATAEAPSLPDAQPTTQSQDLSDSEIEKHFCSSTS